MFLGQTDTTRGSKPAEGDRLSGFSGGGFSTTGDIFSAVYDNAKNNESMFGLQQNFQDIYTKNSQMAQDLAEEHIPLFETLRFKDVARSLKAGEALGDEDQGDYLISLDLVNEKLKKLKETHPDIQTFEEMFATIKTNAKATEVRAADVLSRASNFGSAVGFMSEMVGAFNTNDPLNIASLPLGGWGKSVAMRLLTEAGVGGTSEAINQFLGVKENRELLGLENSTWRSAQQILFAAGGAAAFRGVVSEAAPAVFRAAERKIAPSRAAGRELLKALEDVGIPVRSDEFVYGVTRTLGPQRSGARAGLDILKQEVDFARSNVLGDTPEGRAAHQANAAKSLEEHRAGLEDEMNGVEPPRTSIFEGMGLRGGEETRGVEVARVTEILDTASKDVDVEIKVKADEISRLESDIEAVTEKLDAREKQPFSELLREALPEKADELAAIELEKAKPNLGKTRRAKLAKAENAIRQSRAGKEAVAARKADVESTIKERDIQRAKVQAAQKEVRALELRRERVRAKAQKGIDTTPKKVLTPVQDKAREAGVQLADAAPLRVRGIGDRGGLSPAEHVQTTMTRLEASDPVIPQRADEAVARVERSFDEVDGTYDIGADTRVSGDMVVALDDGASMTLRDHLADIRENERVVEAMRSCAI
jgi:hypothetical protein